MIDHADARMLASARADGELDPSRGPELDEHLAACDACGAFTSALPRLSMLAAVLPREPAPDELPERVRARLRTRGLSRTAERQGRAPRRWRVAPALAAAAVVALVATLVGSIPIVRIPAAAASEALGRVTSLFVEREITFFGERGEITQVTREKTWFRAPGFVRVESTTDGVRTVTIERPGVRYREDANDRVLETGLLPSTTSLPEPLSPTVALLGTETGPGPTVLGRPTRRIQMTLEGDRRVAYVDGETYAVLDIEESVVLQKETFQGGRLRARKQTIALDYNPDLPDSLFAIPAGVRTFDRGAVVRPVGTLTAPPAGSLEGVRFVTAASGAQGEAILYARGAFQILIEIDGPGLGPVPARREFTRVGGRRAELVLPLYGLPEVRFRVGAHDVTVRASLPPAQLLELAERMYP